MATHWTFDLETLVLSGTAVFVLLLYCFIGRFGMENKMGKHSDDDY